MTIIQGIKISANVGAGGTSGTIYTVPANTFALVQIHNNFGSASPCFVDGRPIYVGAQTAPENTLPLYLGPGAVLSVTNNGANWTVSGVEFINT